MAKTKTKATTKHVDDFIGGIDSEKKRDDCFELIRIFQDVTGYEAAIWGPSIIGFGAYHYKYESGHEGDAPLAAFSPRKTSIVIYLMDFPGRDDLLLTIGKCKTSKGCVYIKKLDDIKIPVLKKGIDKSVRYLKKVYS